MALAQMTRLLSLTDAIERGVQAALDGQPVAEIASELWRDGLDAEATDAAVVIGLRTLIHQHLATQRRPVQDDDEAAGRRREGDKESGRPVVNIHYSKEHWQRVLSANYEAADGSRKALYAFTTDDAAHLRLIANNRADGYLRLRDAMDAAITMLQKHRKPTIGALPEKAQRALAEALA